MLSHTDLRRVNGFDRAEKVANFYEETGVIDFLAELVFRGGYSQEDMAEMLVEAGYVNSRGEPHFHQTLISRLIRDGKESGRIPEPV